MKFLEYLKENESIEIKYAKPILDIEVSPELQIRVTMLDDNLRKLKTCLTIITKELINDIHDPEAFIDNTIIELLKKTRKKITKKINTSK